MSVNDNRTMRLPSGVSAVRVDEPRRRYVLGALGVISLTVADVEALYADSIAGDGGRELPEPPEPRKFCGNCHAGYVYPPGDDFCGLRCDCNPLVSRVVD